MNIKDFESQKLAKNDHFLKIFKKFPKIFGFLFSNICLFINNSYDDVGEQVQVILLIDIFTDQILKKD